MGGGADAPRPGPPPLRPFGLVLHHDGRWTHEGVPLRNERLRAAFDVAVRFLPDEGREGNDEGREGNDEARDGNDKAREGDEEREGGDGEAGSEVGPGKYVVQLGRFRGQIEVEEAAFFVRSFDPASGEISLSDRSVERVDLASLTVSERDGALLCRIKRELAPSGLLARFRHAAQAELMNAVEETPVGPRLRVAGVLRELPDLEEPESLS